MAHNLQYQNADTKCLEDMVYSSVGLEHASNEPHMVEVSLWLWARKDRLLVMAQLKWYMGTEIWEQGVGVTVNISQNIQW